MQPRIKNGTGPHRPRWKNWDYIKTHHPEVYAGSAKYPTFADELTTDAGFGMPDQNAEEEPEGCTNFASSELANNLTGKKHYPKDLERITHANALGGFPVGLSLDMARKYLGWFGATFQIHAKGILDFFDAFRLAQGSGLPEKRAISIALPWFTSWEEAMSRGESLMQAPTNDELMRFNQDWRAFSWHDSVFEGWIKLNGSPVYRDKSFQGTHVGDGGWIYFPRDVVNLVMSLPGTVAYVATQAKPTAFSRVDLALIQKWMSYIRTWLGFAY